MALNALGFIETKGLVCALEAADIMLKAAKVELIGKESNGGYVTIIIKGDIAAVRIAVSTGSAAAKRIGKLISAHVIPEPDEKLYSVIGRNDDKKEIKKAEIILEKSLEKENLIKEYKPKFEAIKEKQVNISEENSNETVKEEKPKKEIKQKIKSKPKKEFKKEIEPEYSSLFDVSANDTISRLRREALNIKQKNELKKPGENKPVSNQNIETLNVHQLRRLARDYNNFPIKGREISKANRQELIDHFKNL